MGRCGGLTTPPVEQLLHNRPWKAESLLNARSKSAFIQQVLGRLNSQEPKPRFQLEERVAVLF